MNWQQVGRELVEGLEGIENEETIRLACSEVMQQICSAYGNPASRKKPLSLVRKEISNRWPSTATKASEHQYLTSSGKGNVERYEHLALKYLTLSERDWDELRGDATPVESEVNRKQIEAEPPRQTKEFNIKDMDIKQLELDAETEGMVNQAIEQSGMNLAEFIQKACQVYAKTVTGKARKFEEDLATVPTEKLLNDVAYSTHPGRPDELTKRAIRAIEIYNDEIATENKYRWCITQTIITELTGSRAESVKRIMGSLKQRIDDHNAKYELNPYSNRKRGIELKDEVKLTKLVPSGIE